MAEKHGCDICDSPGTFELRIHNLESNQGVLFSKIDKMNTYLIASLTTGMISAILLFANLFVIYGGK